jgi:hypothetical protein
MWVCSARGHMSYGVNMAYDAHGREPVEISAQYRGVDYYHTVLCLPRS